MLDTPNNYYERFELTSKVSSYDATKKDILTVATEGEKFI